MENEKQRDANENEAEEILDDDYLVQLHHYLLLKKRERKQAEQDANLLDCRLRCLRGEEEKTKKKIEVTRKKTENKMLSLEEQDTESQRRLAFKKYKEEELLKKKEQAKYQKDNNKMAILIKQDEKKRAIEAEVKSIREQRKTNEEIRKYMEIEELSNKKTQADYIKSQQIIAEEKRRAIELEKKNKVKIELEMKINEEEMLIQEAENRKERLEHEEIELMKKIKTTTQLHEQMIENYEKLGTNKGQSAKK